MPALEDELGVLQCFTCYHAASDSRPEDRLSESESSACTDKDKDNSSSDSEDCKAAEVFAQLIDEIPVGIFLGRRAAGKPDDVLIQHRKLKTVHLCHDELTLTLSCGRKFEFSSHAKLESMPTFRFPKCKDCFGNNSSTDDDIPSL